MLLSTPVPEQMPGEPANPAVHGPRLLVALVLHALLLALLTVVLLPLWLPVLGLAALYGAPPNVPRAIQIRRYLHAAWTETPPAPGLSFGHRCWIFLTVLRQTVTIPLAALAWYLDEILYGSQLNALELRAPLLEISAGRSGSTQLARYLEDDPRLAAPPLYTTFFPYLWLWKLASATLGRVLTKDAVRQRFEAMLPPEFLERHEGDPFRTDTFDAVLFTSHLNFLSLFLGPRIAAEDFSFARIGPSNQVEWEEDFVRLLERIGRKYLLFSGPTFEGQARRLFVKGHFLCAAPALARRFPDGRFLTMIRHPEPRFQSGVNYLRVNPPDPILGAPPWAWLAQAMCRTEVDYCDIEKAWFTKPEGPRRMVVRFDSYVKDLPGTLQRIYAELLDGQTPPPLPPEHTSRRRSNYRVNRSLEEVGIDREALKARLADYIAWCEGR